MHFSPVRLLSRAATLKKVWNLSQEIKLFMESKHQNVAVLDDENWLNDIPFLTDIMQHLSELNLNLQGKRQLVDKMLEHIYTFDKTLKLLQVQLGRDTLTHFTCLPARKMEFPDFFPPSMQQVFKSYVMSSQAGFHSSDEIKVKLFAYPFDLTVEDSPDVCQMILIELQADMDTKWGYSENSFVDIYKPYVCGIFSNVHCNPRKIIFLFGSTYCCEQIFF